jgi:murein L,D-transpeptidase YafK
MWYKIKRNFQYYLKCIDVHFKTKRKYKEIANAYIFKKSTVRKRFSINPWFIIWGSIGVFLILIIMLTILNSDKIAVRIRAESTRLQKNNMATDIKTETAASDINNISVKNQDVIKPEQKENDKSNNFVIHEELISNKNNSEHTILSFSRLTYMIYANKRNRKLHLLKKNNSTWSIYRTYSIAIGENLGRKMKAGDKKTPEGLYFIIGRKESNELPGTYGPLAFVLNYPNEEDRKKGRTGSGIWIHGTNPDSMPIQTRGCLEMNNSDLTELADILKSGIGTPIKIVNIEKIHNPFLEINFNQLYENRKKILENYFKKRNFFIAILKTWEDAWESKDIEEYSTCYYPDRFFGQGLKWDAWKQKKERTFKLYEMIEISIDKIFLSDYSDSIAVIKFVQAYKSDKINVINGKKLQFVNNNGIWKIFSENTFPKEEHLL